VPWRPLAATALAGFAAFTLEVALTRAAVNVFGASTYALTAILVAFLLGLGLGAPFAGRASGDPVLARKYLTWALLAAALLTRLGVLGFQYYLGLDDPYRADNRFPRLSEPWLLPWYQAAISMILLAPPALALGAAFPLAVGAARAPGVSPDRAAGWVYAVNTLGSLAGTLLTTFVLLPAVESRGAVEVAAGALVVAALAVVQKSTWPAFSVLVLYALLTPKRLGSEAGAQTLYFKEGVASTVRVTSSVNDDGAPIRSLSVNGTVVATQFFLDLRLQRLLGHLPALLHPKPSKALVIGLGTGVTAGSLATTPGVEAVDVVELERSVLTAAALFDDSNERIASGGLPNTRFTIADGRTHLLTTKTLYDVVTCDPIHPWVAGAGNLYSRDCFEQERARLAPGGLTALWLPLYKLRTDDLKVVAATFAAVFDTCALYITGYDAILLGAAGPFPALDGVALRARFARLSTAFAAVEIRSLEDLMSGFALDDAELRAFAAGAPLNTDARPILEYRAPLLYLTDYATDFLRFAGPRRADLGQLFGPGLRLDAAAVDRSARVRALALSKFAEFAATDIGRSIREASKIFRTEPR
jgi:spermidine synthase